MPLRVPRPSLRCVAVAVLCGLAASSLCAQARLASLEVAIWPEYDRPSVLVMLRATVAPDATLPALVELPMPSSVGAPHAVAKQGPNGEMLLAQHTIETEGEWSTVRLLTDVPGVRLEYYAPLPPGPQRRYAFSLPAGFEIDELSYEVLLPAGASNLSVTPPADGIFQADGLTFYGAALGRLSARESFTLELAYVKSSSELTSPDVQVATPVETSVVPAEQTGTGSPVVFWAWIIAGAAVLVALVAVVVALRRPPPAPGRGSG